MYAKPKNLRPSICLSALVAACMAIALVQAARPSDIGNERRILAKANSLFGKPTKWDSHVFLTDHGFGVGFWFDTHGRLFRANVSPVRYLKDDNAEHRPFRS